MLRRFLLSLAVAVTGLGLTASALVAHGQDNPQGRGRKYKAPPPTGRIEVTVLKDVNGKPIENAAVIFHPLAGDKDNGNMELKTNEDGKTTIDIIPLGDTVRLQIIARGFQTYGEDYKIDKADLGIEVRMKRPGEQYSIYKIHDLSPSGGKTPDAAPAETAPPPPSETAPQTTPPPAKPQQNQGGLFLRLARFDPGSGGDKPTCLTRHFKENRPWSPEAPAALGVRSRLSWRAPAPM